MSHPVFTQEDAAHIGVVQKFDAVEVINFTFVEIGNVPKVANRVEVRPFLALCHSLNVLHFKGFGIRHAVDYAHAFLTPVHTSETFEESVAFGFEGSQLVVEFLGSYHFSFHLILCRRCRFWRRTWHCRACRTWSGRSGCSRLFGCCRLLSSRLFSHRSFFFRLRRWSFCIGSSFLCRSCDELCFSSGRLLFGLRCSGFSLGSFDLFFHLIIGRHSLCRRCSNCTHSIIFCRRRNIFSSLGSNFRGGIFRLRRQLFFFFHYASSCSLSSSLYSCCISFL